MAGNGEVKIQQPDGGGQRKDSPATSTHETTPEPQTGVPIQINARLIDPESQLPGGEDFKQDASRTNYIIIQLTKLPSIEQQDQLEKLGVKVRCNPLQSPNQYHVQSWLNHPAHPRSSAARFRRPVGRQNMSPTICPQSEICPLWYMPTHSARGSHSLRTLRTGSLASFSQPRHHRGALLQPWSAQEVSGQSSTR